MKSRNKLNVIALIISLIGMIDSAYLAVIKLTNNRNLCLPGLGDCWTVNNSQYSEIFGIPLSFFGFVAYLSIFLLLTLEIKSTFWLKYSVIFTFVFSLSGVIISIYLTYLQFFVIKALCPFCLFSACTMTTLFVISLIRFINYQPEQI
ncbi:MAG: vitamin K epoxide reductase family protein [Anaerolineaceae bacterium]